MKVLLTGSTGQLGKTLIVVKPNNVELITVSSADFNLLDYKSCEEFILSHKPDWVINAAAYTAVDKAESESELATKKIVSEYKFYECKNASVSK